jgi:hypothetical protein
MDGIYAVVTLTSGLVTDDSTVTVNGLTVPVVTRTEQWGRLAPKRITETLADMGYQTVRIEPSDQDSVRVLVEPATGEG